MLISFIGLIFSIQIAHADSILFKVAPIDVSITSEIELSDAGAKMECRFSHPNEPGQYVRQVPLLTRLTKISGDRYRLMINQGRLREWMPGYDRDQCAYIFFIFGKDENRFYMGEISLAGNLERKLTNDEWLEIENEILITNKVKSMINGAHLIIQDIRGKKRIVIQ